VVVSLLYVGVVRRVIRLKNIPVFKALFYFVRVLTLKTVALSLVQYR
jgi:hypothetical protein